MPTVLSLEQALALPYATQRFVNLGWRVIRIETPAEKGENAGDPNRYIGADLGPHGLHSYYVAPNIGKEAITINLKVKEGQDLLKEIIRKLEADVFLCNTLPKRYNQLGIDYETLKTAKPNLIWCGISAIGPSYPDRAGYDPALQALLGFTYLTGETDGRPVPCGIPVIDLKAGDEAFIQVILAMLEKNENKEGKQINISMAQCAASWLITALPQLEFTTCDDELFKRSGNEHRSFIPSNAYPVKDGYVYLAIGNDLQWKKLVSEPEFSVLDKPERRTNKGRMQVKDKIYREIGEITKNYNSTDFINFCMRLNLAVAPINSIKDVAELPFIKNNLLKTILPSGKEVKLFPPSYNTEFLKKNNFLMKCSPGLGHDNIRVLDECGFSLKEIYDMKKSSII